MRMISARCLIVVLIPFVWIFSDASPVHAIKGMDEGDATFYSNLKNTTPKDDAVDTSVPLFEPTVPPATNAPALVAAPPPPAPRIGAPADPDAVAVIVTNASYRGDIPPVDYAHNDGKAVRDYVIDGFGVEPRNIVHVQDAGLADMLDLFGNEREHRGRVWSLVRPGRSKLFVFYSGHGVPGSRDRRGYMLPVDAEASRPEIGGYPLDLLYANLEKIDTAGTVVMIDACFSGQSAGGTLIEAASPVFMKAELPKPAGGLMVLAAAKADQVASWDRDARLGLFTNYLLRGLQGQADGASWGDGDGRVTLAEIGRYLGDEMSYAARRYHGRVQDPDVAGEQSTVLAEHTLRPAATPHGAATREVSASVAPAPAPRESLAARPTPSLSAKPADRSAAGSANVPEVAMPTDLSGAHAFVATHRDAVQRAIRNFYKVEGRVWDFIHLSRGSEDFAKRIKSFSSMDVVGVSADGIEIAIAYDWIGDDDYQSYPATARMRLAVSNNAVDVVKMWK